MGYDMDEEKSESVVDLGVYFKEYWPIDPPSFL